MDEYQWYLPHEFGLQVVEYQRYHLLQAHMVLVFETQNETCLNKFLVKGDSFGDGLKAGNIFDFVEPFWDREWLLYCVE